MLHKKFFVVLSTSVALGSTASYANASFAKTITLQMSNGSYGPAEMMFALMIFHHKGALQFSSINADARNFEVNAMASSIESTQSAEIPAMQSMPLAIK
jgi:uncharacterized protein (DUF305 family)